MVSPIADYDLGTARGKIKIDGSEATKGVDDASKSVDKFTANATKVGGSLQKTGAIMGGIGVAAVAGFAVAIKASADFEKRISGIGAVSNATDKELDAARKKALQLGADTVFSAGEAAGAMEELVKSGLTLPQVMNGAADATVALAAAGEVDLKTAALIASNAMNTFKLSAEDMPHVADLIAGAANASAIDVGELGQSLQQAGAVAKLAGLSLDDTTTAIAAMGNAGIRGSDAGTSLKTFLQNLQPTTEKQIELMTKLGLVTLKGGVTAAEYGKALEGQQKASEKVMAATQDLKDLEAENTARGPARNAQEQIKRSEALRDAQAKLGDAQKDQIKINQAVSAGVGKMSNAFYDANGNLKPLSQVSQVLQDSLKGMAANEKQMALETIFGTDAIRAAAVVADTGAQGFNDLATNIDKVKAADVAAKRLDNLSGDLEQLRGSLETALITTGAPAQEAVRGIVQNITKLTNAFAALSPATQKNIVKGIALVGGLLALGGAFIYIVGTAFKFYTAMKRLQSAFTMIKELKAVQSAMTALNASFLANPVFLVIAAIVLLGVALFVAYKKIKPFHEFVDNLWQSFQAGWDIVLPVLKSIAKAVVDFGLSVGRVFMSAVRAVGAAISFLATVPGKIISFFASLPGIVGRFFMALPRLLGVAIGFLIGTWLRTQIMMWKLAFKLGSGLLSILKDFFSRLPGMAWRFFLLLLDKALQLRSFLIEKAIEIGSGLVDGIINFAKDLPSKMKDIFDKVVETIKGAIGDAFNAVKDFASGMWDGFKKGLFGSPKTKIEYAMDAMAQNAASNTKDLRKSIKTVQGLGSGLPGLAPTSGTSVGSLRSLGLVAAPAPAATAAPAVASSQVSFNVEQVVAQDPMEVMRKTEERKRLANIGGVGRVKFA